MAGGAEVSAEAAAKMSWKLVEWVWRYFDDTPSDQRGSLQLQPDQPVKITGLKLLRRGCQSHRSSGFAA